MTPLDIIVLAFVALILTKLTVIAINPLSWKAVVHKFYSNPKVIVVIGLVLSIVILNYLLKELTIVQIFAAMTFMMALMMMQFGAFGEEIIEMADKFYENTNVLKKAWLSISVWLALIIWVVYELFV